MRIFFAAILILTTSAAVTAQDWEAGVWMGTSHYFGDLNPDFSLQNPRLAGGVLIRYNFNKRLAVKLGGNFGNIYGNDAFSDEVFRRNRNLNFQSPLREGVLEFEFNFLTYEHGSKDNFFTPFLAAGISLYQFNPQANYNGSLIELQPLGTEGQFVGQEYALFQPAIAYSGGFKFDISYEWSLNIIFQGRQLFTDYLDDVSTIYPDKGDLEEARGELAVLLSDRSLSGTGEVGRQRGNSTDRDTFFFLGIGLVYNFARINCPWF